MKDLNAVLLIDTIHNLYRNNRSPSKGTDSFSVNIALAKYLGKTRYECFCLIMMNNFHELADKHEAGTKIFFRTQFFQNPFKKENVLLDSYVKKYWKMNQLTDILNFLFE